MYCGAAKVKFPCALTPKMVLKRCRSCLANMGQVNLGFCCVHSLVVFLPFAVAPEVAQRLLSVLCKLLRNGKRKK